MLAKMSDILQYMTKETGDFSSTFWWTERRTWTFGLVITVSTYDMISFHCVIGIELQVIIQQSDRSAL